MNKDLEESEKKLQQTNFNYQLEEFANSIISTLRADIKATNDNINQIKNEIKNEIKIDKREAKVQFEFIGKRLATMETKIDSKSSSSSETNSVNDDNLSENNHPVSTPITLTQWAGGLKMSTPETNVDANEKAKVNLNLGNTLAATKNVERKSVMKQLAEQTDNEKNRLVMYQQQPSFDHIKLVKLDIPSVVKFMEDLANYQSMYGIALPVPTLVSPKIREIIISRNYYLGINVSNFYLLKTIELLEYLREAIKPTDKVMFQTAITRYVEFEIHPLYKPNSSYFKPMFEALLAYRTKFLNIFNFMAENNAANMPRIDTKEGGAVKIFLSKIPFGYGAKLSSALVIPKKGWGTLESFLDEFYKVVQSHYKISQQSYALANHFDSKIGHEVFSGENHNANQKYKNSIKVDKVNNIEMIDGYEKLLYDINDDDDVNLNDASTIQYNTETNADVQQSNLTNVKELDCNDAEVEADMLLQNTFNLASKNNVNTPQSNNKSLPPACFQMLMYGECKRIDKCTYSHEMNVLDRACEVYMDLLRKKSYSTNKNGGNMSIARRPPGYQTSK